VKGVVVAFAAAGTLWLVLAGDALGCVRVDEPMGKRLDDSDAAVVGHVISRRQVELRGAAQLLLTVEVEQRVKGRHIGGQIVVRSPLHTDCDVTIAGNKTVGLLLTEAPGGALLATSPSVVDPAELVAAGGEPRGGVIKVGVGLVILGVVVLWALRRLRRGARPELPGAPLP
jgi:hypothetical protein